jgi:hypothetical protein
VDMDILAGIAAFLFSLLIVGIFKRPAHSPGRAGVRTTNRHEAHPLPLVRWRGRAGLLDLGKTMMPVRGYVLLY